MCYLLLLSLLEGLLDLGEAGGLGLAAGVAGLLVAHTLGGVGGLLGEGVELEAETTVLDAVGGLGEAGGLLGLELLGLEDAADLLGLHDAGDVGAGQHGLGEGEALLDGGGLGEGAEDLVELLEGGLGPDEEASDVSSGGEVEEVQGVDVGDVEAEDVAEGADTLVIGEHEHGATAVHVATVAGLAGSGADLLGVVDAVDVVDGVDGLEEGDGLLGLVVGLDGVLNDEGNLGDLLDLVSAGHEEGGQGGGGQGAHDGEALLVEVDLAMPATVDLGGGEHTSTTAHVTEGTTAGAVDTGNTCDGTAGTPGGSGVVHAGKTVDGVGLTAVLGHVGVHELNDVVTDGGGEDGGEGGGSDNLILGGRVHVHGGASRHFVSLLLNGKSEIEEEMKE